MVNIQVGLFDRSLTNLSTVNPGTFIGAKSGAVATDPQIQWDQQAGRWLYVELELYTNATNNFIAFGWSKAGDLSGLTLANSDWCNFHIPTGTDLHDYPKLGHDANFILIGTNVFASPTSGISFTSAVWAIPKPAAGDMSCTAPVTTEFGTAIKPLRHLPPDSSLVSTPVPANAADNASTGFIAAIDTGFIGVWHVSPTAVGICAAPCLVGDGEIAISPSPTRQGAAQIQIGRAHV